MPRITITLPEKTYQYVSSMAIKDNESLSKIINRLIQIGMHYMYTDKGSLTPARQYCHQAVIQSHVLVKHLAANILKYEKQDFDKLQEMAANKLKELEKKTV